MNENTDLQAPSSSNPNWRTFSQLQLPPILVVALRQFREHGYHATTVRMIAREVGVTVPAIYYHFENKQALLVALLDHAMGIVTSHIEGALQEAEDTPPAQLSAVVEAIALYMAYHRDIAFLDAERRALSPEHLTRYIHARDGIERPLREILRSGVALGLFGTPDPDECGRAILAMCQGIAAWFHLDGPVPAGVIASRYTRLALAAAEYRLL